MLLAKHSLIDVLGNTEQLIKYILAVEGVKVVLSCRRPVGPGRKMPKGEGEHCAT